jgi:hypothetical protein
MSERLGKSAEQGAWVVLHDEKMMIVARHLQVLTRALLIVASILKLFWKARARCADIRFFNGARSVLKADSDINRAR